MLLTDWYCIMQSGATVDGRQISPQWLHDMADTYDPDLYTAQLNYEHMSLSTYGIVRKLKTGTAGDDVTLLARIEPNEQTIYLNKANRGKFFSVEFFKNFRATGKAYLGGLALTDAPASVGTSQLKFSADNAGLAIAPGVAIPPAFAADIELPPTAAGDTGDDRAAAGFVRRLFRALGSLDPTDSTTQDTTMDKQQFTQLTDSLTGVADSVAQIAEKFATLEKRLAADGENAGTEKNADDKKAADSSGAKEQPPTDFAAQIEKLNAGIAGVAEKLAALAKEQPGTATAATPGPVVEGPAGLV